MSIIYKLVYIEFNGKIHEMDKIYTDLNSAWKAFNNTSINDLKFNKNSHKNDSFELIKFDAEKDRICYFSDEEFQSIGWNDNFSIKLNKKKIDNIQKVIKKYFYITSRGLSFIKKANDPTYDNLKNRMDKINKKLTNYNFKVSDYIANEFPYQKEIIDILDELNISISKEMGV